MLCWANDAGNGVVEVRRLAFLYSMDDEGEIALVAVLLACLRGFALWMMGSDIAMTSLRIFDDLENCLCYRE